MRRVWQVLFHLIPLSCMLAQLTTWLRLVGVGGLCSLSLWALLHAASSPDAAVRVVRYADAVSGRIARCQVNRQQHLFFFHANPAQAYNFNAFGPLHPSTFDQQLSLEEQNARGLGQYLQVGDSVSKAAGSTRLRVQRGASDSQWVCAPQCPPPKGSDR
jgi:hypothetical protein